MEKHNHTAVTKVGPNLFSWGSPITLGSRCLFLESSSSYTRSVMVNLGKVFLTHLDSKLHNPMYFFLRHLPITDLVTPISLAQK